ncbi:hypothetical protein NL676_033077 [Syzygium grande]|nr:hypothetical protein NL676_033077 [Syzygium grande]
MYGRTRTLKELGENGIGAPALGVGAGKDGVMAYAEIVGFNEQNGSTVVYDPEIVSTYSYAGTSWIGYDGPTSIENKVKFVKE